MRQLGPNVIPSSAVRTRAAEAGVRAGGWANGEDGGSPVAGLRSNAQANLITAAPHIHTYTYTTHTPSCGGSPGGGGEAMSSL